MWESKYQKWLLGNTLSDVIRSVEHYENFPVASFMIPKNLQQPIITVYEFARLADDIADEGIISSNDRLEL